MSRFRKGKKAYHSDTEKRSSKWKVLAYKYVCMLDKVKERRKIHGKITASLAISMQAFAQIAHVRSQPNMRDFEKGIATAHIAINTSHAMAALWK